MVAVSYVITVYNKEDYIPEVVRSLESQVGIDEKEYIFVDDGSQDHSIHMIELATKNLDAKTVIIKQENLGASWATNAGVAAASHEWIKLCDGDDLLTPNSSQWLIEACERFNVPHAWGPTAYFEWKGKDDPLIVHDERPEMELMADGLKFFIRNNPANSTSMLFKKSYYEQIGGCDPRLVSPDQFLFFRLFAHSQGARVHGDVGLLPNTAPDRLSAQRGRSRYESILAMYFLFKETPELMESHLDFAYKRALSRAERFHRKVSGRFVNKLSLDHIRSKILPHADKLEALKNSLRGFTPDGSIIRGDSWKTGAQRKGKAPSDF